MKTIKKLLLAGIAALFLATGTARAEDCAENDQRVTCDNPTGWIAQCNNGDKDACKAINDLLAQVDDDERRPFEERWTPAKWECALKWQGEIKGEAYYYPEAYIEREDVPKIIKASDATGCRLLPGKLCLDIRSSAVR